MAIFYRGKHSEKRWWEFWKPRGVSKKIEEHTEISINVSEEIELFKLEFEKDEATFKHNLCKEMQSLDINRFLRDCLNYLYPIVSYNTFYHTMSKAVEESKSIDLGCSLMLSIFSKDMWNEVKIDEIHTMA